jgi:hypothetical protein
MSVVTRPVFTVDEIEREVIAQKERREARFLISIRTCNPLNNFDRLPDVHVTFNNAL